MSKSKQLFASWPGFEHKVPIMRESRQGDYITYGLVNEYPYYLLDNYRRSSKHNAIINGKVDYIMGNGWKIDPDSTVESQAQFIKFFNSVCGEDDLNDFTEKLVLDFEIFNGFAIEITWAVDGRSIASMRHVPFEKIRLNKDDSMFQVAEWYSEDLAQLFPKPIDIVKYVPFDENKRIGKQLYYYRVYSAGVKHYPLPTYLGGLAWVEADVQIANYHNSNLRNNFWGGYLINLNNGIPTMEEQADIERQIKRKFSGTDNAGRFVVSFNDDSSKAPTLLPLVPSDLDKQFDVLNKTVQQEIFTAHRVTSPMLFGIRVESQLGGRNEMIEAYELFKNTYINGRVQRIERVMNYLANFNGIQEIMLTPVDPVTERLSEQSLLQIMTQDELREKAGLDPIEKVNPESGQSTDSAQEMVANENIRKLSGREYQNLMRIVRHYVQGKITLEMARTMLSSGFGLSGDEVDTLLGVNKQSFSQATRVQVDEQEEEWTDEHSAVLEALTMQFGDYIENFDEFASKQIYLFDDHQIGTQLDLASRMAFAELSAEDKDLDERIIKVRKEIPTIRPKELAKKLGVSIPRLMRRINYLKEAGKYPMDEAIDEVTAEAKRDTIATIRADEGVSKAQATRIQELETRYRYQWIKPYTNADLKRSRKFCQIMMGNTGAGKVYTRQEIDSISSIMNYNVWTRRGGWWRMPNGVNSPSCRHTWEQVIVRRKSTEEFSEEQEFESYDDYGQDVRNNAKRGIELNEKNGNKCAQAEGKIRAQQLAQGKKISLSTIKRMHSFLSRAEGYYDDADESSDCGYISYLLWGGKSALSWSRNKLRELGELNED